MGLRPKQTKNWKDLVAHQKTFDGVHMRDMFDSDADRADKFSLALDGFHLDYSKHLITEKTVDHLVALADKSNLKEKTEAFFQGEHINTSEDKPALHPYLRGPVFNLNIDGENVTNFVDNTKARIHILSDKIRSNPNITDVISIGIGGSDLGPHMVCRALATFSDGPRIHFVSNIDGAACNNLMQTLSPQNTMIIIASKTFTTLETMTNANTLLNWLTGLVGQQALNNQVIAITMNEQAARDMGIPPEHILPLRGWIGGRYSVWSAIGLTIAVSLGFEHFNEFLRGAHEMDEHFHQTTDYKKSIPVIMALLSIWYRNFWHYSSHAILPYAQHLQHLPGYLQQLDMESNGKSVDLSGDKVHMATAPLIFGAPGTNSQHAFVQALHQGTDIIPSDFIIVAFPEHSLISHHRSLIANALAQSQALMQGNHSDEGHKNFPGNRPSSTIILDRLDAYHLGMLLAAYEHKIFVQGVIWNINSFDQWGVDLGKDLAKNITLSLQGTNADDIHLDSSTENLLHYLKQKIY